MADVHATVLRRDDDPLDAMGEEELDDRHDVRDVRARELLEDDRVPRGLRFLSQAVEGLRHAEGREAPRDDADHLAPPADEAARDGAGLEPVQRDGRLDQRPRLGRHVGALVDDAGDRLHGDAGLPCDLLDRHRVLARHAMQAPRRFGG